MLKASDSYQDIRDAVRDLCAQYPAAYFRTVDMERAYPEAFVNALTQAGWLAALIRQEYGGCGLGLTQAPGKLGEIHPCGGYPVALHGQKSKLGSTLSYRSQPE